MNSFNQTNISIISMFVFPISKVKGLQMVGNLFQSNYSEIFYMENEEERNPFYFLFVSIFPLQR